MSPVPPPAPAPAPAPAASNAINKTIRISSAAERFEIAAAEACSTFVNCNLVAPSVEEDERKPIDLIVVLDRSGSMAGAKLALCKKTMEFLAQQLTAQDRVALVSYDTHVTTDLALTKMTAEGKAFLSQRVQAIQAGSMTNLSGGLLAGVDAVQQPNRADNGEPNPVKSVLLLTDGQANEGITSPAGLASMLQGVLDPQVSVHTFGYGSDHDATLLGQLADIGRGSYYFVQNVDGVALAFANCLGGLLSVVAQNIKLECIASPGVLIQSVKTKRPVTTVTNQVHYEVDMGDMFADESRDLLVEVQLTPQNPQESMNVVEFRLRYANVVGSSMDKASSTATISRPAIVKNEALNEQVVLQKQRVLAAEAIEAAQAQATRGNLAEGRNLIAAVKEKLETEMAKMPTTSAYMAPLLNDLVDCTTSMATESAYRNHGHGHMQQRMQKVWMQRSNNIEVNDEEELDRAMAVPMAAPALSSAFGSAAPAAAPAPAPGRFGNMAQTRMMKKAFNLSK
ncbi:unnamed protein product [Aphanomyces euteiches]|uniref:VWFA domain-containing protein n=1 Tax=Aphanomyces euteiches TaxID=100861 RepID=A0A6G0WND7_9STRA|nr:hypothetical protein Ae201684_013416 [Aphanomyces euteiches]KAH9063134.1 hypothetical protein Ae201684P_009397 [Aphanomyces euteiches]